jgi:hypothetical protein
VSRLLCRTIYFLIWWMFFLNLRLESQSLWISCLPYFIWIRKGWTLDITHLILFLLCLRTEWLNPVLRQRFISCISCSSLAGWMLISILIKASLFPILFLRDMFLFNWISFQGVESQPDITWIQLELHFNVLILITTTDCILIFVVIAMLLLIRFLMRRQVRTFHWLFLSYFLEDQGVLSSYFFETTMEGFILE